jgi:hypothetical protein
MITGRFDDEPFALELIAEAAMITPECVRMRAWWLFSSSA